MYSVILTRQDGTDVEVHNSLVNSVKLTSAKITKAVNDIDAFSFTCTPQNQAYNNVRPLITLVKVINTRKHKTLFSGRVLNADDVMSTAGELSKDVVCESELAYLHDSYQNYNKWQNISPADFFAKIIEVHNNQVEQYKRFEVGVCDVKDSNNAIYRYTADETSTFDTIKDKLIDRLGGELQIRYQNGIKYLDYLQTTAKQGSQIIRLAKNLRSLKQSVDASNIITVLKPLGATLENQDTDSDASKPRLTIESVNNGSKWLKDDAKIAQFGIQSGVETWDDVTDANNLLTKAKAFLASQKTATVQYQLEAVDLSLIDNNVDDFECGNYHKVINPVMGIDDNLRIVGQTIDLIDVANSTLTIGDKMLSQEELAVKTKKQLLANQNNNQNILDLENGFADLTEQNDKFKDMIADLQTQIDDLKNNNGGGSTPIHVGKIIDVSEWQGAINWASVKNDDVSLAIIRVQDGSSHQDLKYMENIQQAIANGLKYAVYAYFRGVSTSDAQTEARDFYNRTQQVVSGKQQPVFYAIDVESVEMGGDASAMRGGVEAYMNQLNALGIPDTKIVLYIANHLYNSFNLNVSRAGAIWIPSYGANDGTIDNSTKPQHAYDLWQYTSKGSIAGISGNVDLSGDASDRFKNNYLR